MEYELFIALGDAAEVWSENYDINELKEEVENGFSSSIVRKVFETEEQMRFFQEGLEFCTDECNGFLNFWVIVPDGEKEREILMELAE